MRLRSVVHRLVLGFGLLIPVVAFAALSISSSISDAQDAQANAEGLNDAVAKAVQVEDSLVLQQALQAEFAITKDPELMVVFEQTAQTAFGTMDELEAQFADNDVIQRIAAELEALDIEHDAIIFDEMVPAFEAGDEAAGLDALARAQVVLDDLLGVVSQSSDAFRAELDAELVRSEDALQRARRTTRMIAVTVIVMITGIACWVGFSVVRPAKKLRCAAKRLASGDVSMPVEVGSRDEFGQLADAFNEVRCYVLDAAQVADRMSGGGPEPAGLVPWRRRPAGACVRSDDPRARVGDE